MTKLTENVLHKIEQERIHPISVWNFRILQSLKWALLAASVFLSGLFTALSLHIISEIDWEAFLHVGVSRYQAILVSLPFLWFGLISLFLFFSILFGRQTRHGYRYTYGILFLLFLFVSASLGATLEKSRFDEPAERFFFGALPKSDVWRQTILPSAEKEWTQPENGLLGGNVTAVDQAESTFDMEDLKQKEWKVNFQNADIDRSVDLKPKTQVNIIGNQKDEDHFQATIIRRPKTAHKQDSQEMDEKDDSESSRSDKEDGAEKEEHDSDESESD